MKRIRNLKILSGLGYKSDMGRIYLSYGDPDRIERFPNESNLKPYEIWHYDNIEGGVLFIFGDLSGFSEYELLHSTKRGEMYDENWRRRISVY
ncbi:MAG: GWxTD domain-containing protein [Melioribacteraceae bacterium]|nr:GWxTD domain-containing protein [Melioribacteraceae bacterium]